MALDDTSRAVGRLEGKMEDLTTEVHNIGDLIKGWKEDYDEDQDQLSRQREADQEVFRATKSKVDIMWRSILWLAGLLAAAAASATTWLLGWIKP